MLCWRFQALCNIVSHLPFTPHFWTYANQFLNWIIQRNVLCNRLPPHLECVATLPCGTKNWKCYQYLTCIEIIKNHGNVMKSNKEYRTCAMIYEDHTTLKISCQWPDLYTTQPHTSTCAGINISTPEVCLTEVKSVVNCWQCLPLSLMQYASMTDCYCKSRSSSTASGRCGLSSYQWC